MTLAAPFSAYMAQIIGSSGGWRRIFEVECPHQFILCWDLALFSSHFSMLLGERKGMLRSHDSIYLHLSQIFLVSSEKRKDKGTLDCCRGVLFSEKIGVQCAS